MQYAKKLLLLVNPKAGRSEIRTKLLQIVDIFVSYGYEVTVHTTQHAGELPEYLIANAYRFHTVVSCGGDGTLNETVTALMQLDIKPRFGYIPTGTVNDFATSIGIPRDMIAAAENIMTGAPFACDIGKFNDRYFAYVAAFGAFTDVSYETPQHAKNILGKLAYLLEGAKRLPFLRSYNIKISHDTGIIEEDILVGLISNSRYIAGLPVGAKIDATIDDGLMEVTLVRKPHSIMDLQLVINALMSNELTAANILRVKTSKLRLTSNSLIPWTLDGEYGGTLGDVTIENHMRALEVIAPRQ